MPLPKQTPPKFQVGDHVEVTFGLRKVSGTVVEDRGQIGVGGRRLYGISLELSEDDEPEYIELPELEIEPVSV